MELPTTSISVWRFGCESRACAGSPARAVFLRVAGCRQTFVAVAGVPQYAVLRVLGWGSDESTYRRPKHFGAIGAYLLPRFSKATPGIFRLQCPPSALYSIQANKKRK